MIRRLLFATLAIVLFACGVEVVSEPLGEVSQALDYDGAAGAHGWVQYNDDGGLGASSALVFDPTKTSLRGGAADASANGLQGFAWGPGSNAGGTQSFASGYNATTPGNYSVAQGYDVHANSSFDVVKGAHNIANGVANVAIGENITTSNSNTVGIGFQIVNPANFASAMGSYVSVATGATGSVVLGINATAARPGELAHGSGISGTQGYFGSDLARTLAGVPGDLQNRDGLPFKLTQGNVWSMRVRLMASKTDGTARGHEVHELLLHRTSIPWFAIDSDQTIASCPGGGLSGLGWSATFIPAVNNELRILIDPGPDTVRAFARVEFSQIIP